MKSLSLFVKYLGLSILFLTAGSGLTQDRPPFTLIDLGQGESAEAYEKSIRFSRIQSKINYIDDLYGEIPMDGAPPFKKPEPQEPAELPSAGGLGEFNLGYSAALLAVVGILGYLLYKFSGGAGQRFANTNAAARDRRGQTQASNGDDLDFADQSELIGKLRSMSDREAALVLLIEHTLSAAAESNRMRLGRSETARELLRRLPQNWSSLPDLRRIVMAEELVQFGGRALAEATFDDCLRRAAPILRGRAA